MKIKFLIIGLVFLAFTSCKKEDGPSSDSNGKALGTGVMILNEGAFGAVNASVTMYNDKQVKSDGVFESINKRALGDVLQSVTETDDHYYFVVNNSKKIEVVRKSDLRSEATITGFRSPRYMLDLENGKALVSNYVYDSNSVAMKIDIVDLAQNAIVDNIPVDNRCEMMVMNDHSIYVANTGKNQVLVIDRASLTISKTLKTGHQPMLMTKDRNGFIWVLCTGNYSNISASLVRIDPSDNSAGAPMDFPQNFIPERMIINPAGGLLYFLQDGVYTMSVGASSVSLQLIPNTTGGVFPYALGIDPENNQIYIGDAKDFSSNGQVKVYSKDGQLIETITTGVGPNNFVFRK